MSHDARPCCAVGRRSDAAEIDAALRRLGQEGAESFNAIHRRTGIRKPNLASHRDVCLGLGEPVRTDGADDANRPCTDGEPGVVPAKSPFAVPNPGDDSSTTPKKIITAELEERALDLRVSGRTYASIARELGVTWETACDLVERVLIRTIGRSDRKADHLREIEVRRCDALVESLWGVASGTEENDPDVRGRAVDRVLRAGERKAKLLGLDAGSGASMPFYLAPGFDDFLGALLAPLQDRHPEALAEVMDAAKGHIAMLAAQKPAKPGLRLVAGGRSA